MFIAILKGIAALVAIIVALAWIMHIDTSAKSEVESWRTVESVALVPMDLHAEDRKWLEARAENHWRGPTSYWAPEVANRESPNGHKLICIADSSLFSNTRVDDLIFSGPGKGARRVRLMRLRKLNDSLIIRHEYQWSKDGSKVLLFTLDDDLGPALIIYDIRRNEITRIRPAHRYEGWARWLTTI